MFDWDELERYVLGSCPWGAFEEIDLSSPTTSSMQPASYAASTVTIRRYERRFGLLDLAKIDMPWPTWRFTMRVGHGQAVTSHSKSLSSGGSARA